MKIEHVARPVEDPVAAAECYAEHPRVRVPDYRSADPLLFHLAFEVDDVAAEHDRLLAAGATEENPPSTLENGDTLSMVRDPWGAPVQLLKRDP